MAKKFYVFIDRGYADQSEVAEFASSEEVETFLLENKEVANAPEDCWIIFGERFGFQAERVPVGFMLKGPES